MSRGVRRDEAWLARHRGGVAGTVAARRQATTTLDAVRGGKYPLFEATLTGAGLGPFATEFEFHEPRPDEVRRFWRFDYAWPEVRLAVEVEGGIWRKGGGAHSHPLNIERDAEKYTAAGLLGWRVLRYPPEKIMAAIPAIALALGRRLE
jgi:hypothetical protein